MERIHHTGSRAILRKKARKYEQDITDKPNGLWYGIDWAWMEFCKTEMPRTYKNHFSLKLNMKRILIIDTREKMIAFANKYAESPEWKLESKGSPDGFYINWRQVARKYAGVEISPYMGEFRRKYSWYYSYDVPCGCLWDLSVIKAVKKVTNQLSPL